jgi:hypothetical protein
MRVEVLKRDKRYEVDKSTQYSIQTYGLANDYPQNVIEIVNASVTGSGCVKRYGEFINGKGFADAELGNMRVNGRKETFNTLLSLVSGDYARFGGFALLVNYNANYRISSIYHVPFENVRLGLPREDGTIDYAIHPDWGKRNTRLKRFSSEDIVRVSAFNPDAVADEVALVGGFESYKGQLYYYTNNGAFSYPLPCYDAALTDMNTEEGISNITNRNARNNFLPSGMLIDICQQDQTSDEETATENLLKQYQGDANALKLMYAQVGSKEEIPQFVEFKTQNYDKEYTESRNATKDNIGRAFNQPPILRAELTSSGFSTTEMVSAYNYYNSVTINERNRVSSAFDLLLSYWWIEGEYDATIDALSYDVEMTLADKLGNNLSSLLDVVSNVQLSALDKRGICRTIFGLSEAEINQILPL